MPAYYPRNPHSGDAPVRPRDPNDGWKWKKHCVIVCEVALFLVWTWYLYECPVETIRDSVGCITLICVFAVAHHLNEMLLVIWVEGGMDAMLRRIYKALSSSFSSVTNNLSSGGSRDLQQQQQQQQDYHGVQHRQKSSPARHLAPATAAAPSGHRPMLLLCYQDISDTPSHGQWAPLPAHTQERARHYSSIGYFYDYIDCEQVTMMNLGTMTQTNLASGRSRALRWEWQQQQDHRMLQRQQPPAGATAATATTTPSGHSRPRLLCYQDLDSHTEWNPLPDDMQEKARRISTGGGGGTGVQTTEFRGDAGVYSYHINLGTMTQTNLTSGRTRALKWIPEVHVQGTRCGNEKQQQK